MGSILCWPASPERGAFPGVCGLSSSLPLEKFSLSQQVSSANSVLVRGGTLCPLPFSVLRLCLVQALCVCHSLWVHACINSVVSVWCSYPGVFHHLWFLTIFLLPLLHRSRSLEGRGLTETSHLGMRALKTHLLHVVQLCGSVLITVYCVWVSANTAARRVAVCVQQKDVQFNMTQ